MFAQICSLKFDRSFEDRHTSGNGLVRLASPDALGHGLYIQVASEASTPGNKSVRLRYLAFNRHV